MIDCIRTYRLQSKLEKPFGFSQWQYSTRHALLVEVIDSSGTSGWGECYGPAEVTQSAIHSFYASLLIGWDPLCNEAAWQHCWHASLDFARKGIMMGAISGIDMALLDLKGKLLGVSVSELMGGRMRDTVQCYATGMYFQDLSEAELINEIVEEATGYVQEGYRAIKIKIGKNLKFDKKIIKTIRREFPLIQLMADSNHAYDLPEAVEVGRVLDENEYTWFEEPLSPQHPKLFSNLAAKLDVRIATGECEQTRWGFMDLLSSGGIHIAQPDMAYCGGPTEALKIRAVASALGINVIPHAWGTMLNLACATHFLASTQVEPGRIEIIDPILEVDRTSHPIRDEIYAITLEQTNGCLMVPTRPGLGVEPDPAAMESFCVQRTEQKTLKLSPVVQSQLETKSIDTQHIKKTGATENHLNT